MTEKTVSSRVVFEGKLIKVRVDDIQMPSGRRVTREVVEHADCIAVVAVDVADNVLLVSQFRQTIGQDLLEIPAGGIDPGEDPDAAVRREMREETGYLPRKISRLAEFYSAPGYCTEYLYLYLATDLERNPLVAEDTETIKLVRVPAGQIPALLASGRIRDAKTYAGLLVFLERGKNRK